MLDLTTRNIFISRDVVFHKIVFPFGNATANSADPFISKVDTTSEECLGPFVTPISIPDMHTDHCEACPKTIPSSSSLSSTPTCSNHDHLPNSLPSDSTTVLLDYVPSIVTNPIVADQPLRKSTRVHKTIMYLKDYACNSAFALSPASAGCHPPGSPYDLSACLTYYHLDPQYKSYLMIIIQGHSTPQYYSQAVQDPLWKEAMEKEIHALKTTQTWVLTSLSPGKRPIGCKWVHRVKLNPDGSVERYKARLVAKGYTQREGLEFLETFSPVAKTVSIRVLIGLALAQRWPLH